MALLDKNMHVNYDCWVEAKYYLTYALACSWSLKDTIERKILPDGKYYLSALEAILKDRLSEVEKLTGKELQEKVNELVRQADAKGKPGRITETTKGGVS